jgi:2-hydroxychromene-2-carboxylate isomerase
VPETPATGPSAPQIEYFYSAHSAFAYIGHPTLLRLCEAHGCTLIHRPFNLSPVVEAAGGQAFRSRTQHHVDYFFGREIERWAHYRTLEILNHRPTHHDSALDLSNGMLIAAILRGENVNALAFAVLQAHWRDDIDLADKASLEQLCRHVGIDPTPLLEAALGDVTQAIHAENTAEAIERGVFGSPTYFLDGDMFYGQDRLELIEAALKAPFKPNNFKNPTVSKIPE